MVWSVLSGLAGIAGVLAAVSGFPVVTAALGLAAVLISVISGERAKARRRQRFVTRFHSVQRIRETHDLSRFHRLRDDMGEVQAVRAVREEFPGISLKDAVALVRG